MRLKIFAVYDSAAQAYLPPFFMPEIAMAIRVIAGSVRDSTTMFAQHPADYTLFHLGEFDQRKGLLTPSDTPKRICTLLELVPASTAAAGQMDLLEIARANGAKPGSVPHTDVQE